MDHREIWGLISKREKDLIKEESDRQRGGPPGGIIKQNEKSLYEGDWRQVVTKKKGKGQRALDRGPFS